MRIVLCHIVIGLAGCLSTAGAQPNVLIIVADDLGWGDLSANGNRAIETVNIDSLAESGLKFEKFYVCPNGSTTSASLLTGRYHYRTGAVGEAGLEAMMYGSEKTLGEIFGENGYRCGYFGRWRHGENWPHHPAGQGFPVFRDEESPVSAALDFITSENKLPFFCFVKIPHPRLKDGKKIPEEDRLEKVNQGILQLDAAVGKLIDALEDSDQRNESLVVFLSDNGPDQFGETRGRYNGYFYGGKGSVHEGGVRVPCFASWPGTVEPKSTFPRISAHIDWYPTLVELCGLKQRSRQLPVDGTSLATVLRNTWDIDDWPNRILFTSWTPPGYAIKKASAAVRTDRWVALRDPRWRRKEIEKDREWELYDLKTDPFQSHEKGGQFPFLLSELKADYAFFIDHTTDDGIGPIAIQIGHPEWKTVTLRPNPDMTWPVRVIAPGEYEVRLEGVEQCTFEIDGKATRIAAPAGIFLSKSVTHLKVTAGRPASIRLIAL